MDASFASITAFCKQPPRGFCSFRQNRCTEKHSSRKSDQRRGGNRGAISGGGFESEHNGHGAGPQRCGVLFKILFRRLFVFRDIVVGLGILLRRARLVRKLPTCFGSENFDHGGRKLRAATHHDEGKEMVEFPPHIPNALKSSARKAEYICAKSTLRGVIALSVPTSIPFRNDLSNRRTRNAL